MAIFTSEVAGSQKSSISGSESVKEGSTKEMIRGQDIPAANAKSKTSKRVPVMVKKMPATTETTLKRASKKRSKSLLSRSG